MVHVKLAVLRTRSTNIYVNLAFEEHVLRHAFLHEPSLEAILLTYVNSRCFVMGRHQIPWLEIHSPPIEKGVTQYHVARRPSGGGCVYQDEGCLSFSILTPRRSYNPERSLSVVRSALEDVIMRHCPPPNSQSDLCSRKVNLNVSSSPRFDLYLNKEKITGSAMRLLSVGAYHHGTVLVDSDLATLRNVLRPSWSSIQQQSDFTKISYRSSGSPSVPAQVTTLRKWMPSVTLENVRQQIETAFVQEYSKKEATEGLCSANRDAFVFRRNFNEDEMIRCQVGDVWNTMDEQHDRKAPRSDHPSLKVRTYTKNDPKEDSVSELLRLYRSWEWIFGITPRWSVQLPSSIVPLHQCPHVIPTSGYSFKISITIYKARIESCTIEWFPALHENEHVVQEYESCKSLWDAFCIVIVHRKLKWDEWMEGAQHMDQLLCSFESSMKKNISEEIMNLWEFIGKAVFGFSSHGE